MLCEFNHVVHEMVEQATRAIVGSRRMRGRGGGRGAQVRAVRTRLRRTLAAGAWADWHRALVARLQMIDPSPSQAALLMERRARKDGEAARRQVEAQAQRRFDRAESLIKRLVRDNFRELERAFKLGDADGSGSLDATELRNVLFRFDIVLEDEHYAQLLQVTTPTAF